MKQSPAIKVGVLGAILAIVVIGIIASRRTPRETVPAPEARVSRTSPQSTGIGRTVEAAPQPAERATTREAPGPIHVSARLIGGAGATATLTPGAISADDWSDYNAVAKKSGTQEKPKAIVDFAHFASPQAIAVIPDDLHNGVVSFSWVPPAVAYRIDAIRPSDNAWYRARILKPAKVPPQGLEYDFGNITPTLPTGVRLSFENAPPGQEDFELGIERRATAETTERASELLDYVEAVRPDILDALREGTRFAVSSSTSITFAPLPPDPTVHFTFRTLTGVEGGSLDVELHDQQVVDVMVDLASIFRDVPSEAVSLSGRLLIGNTSDPVTSATIEREGAPLAGRQVTDSEGAFAFDGLPPGIACQFDVTLAPAVGPRPIAPPRASFVYTPTSEQEQHVEWRVHPYQWLVLGMTPEQVTALETISRSSPIGQPIFILQRKVEGAFVDDAADEFIRSPGEIAVSLMEAGEYRVVIAANPVYTIISSEASVREGVPESLIRLPDIPATIPTRTLTILGADHSPIKAGRLWINGPHRSTPPISMTIPPSGEITLPPLNAETLNLSVALPNAERTTHSLPSAGSGPLELRLSTP
ncbi:hypothetical protein IT570_13710 [Candidatus Sumerlaeota bacterium]|nr:hypothetical protein [Candidatus Sumerlaeota bacterium]